MSLYTPVSLRGERSGAGAAPASLDDFLTRLSGRESSGSYTAKGIQTRHGHALGKYQVMEEYLPGWSKQYLGRSVTPDEFLASPHLQEQLTRARAQDLYTQHGNWADVASIWHSGRTLAEASKAGAQDGLGTKTTDYVHEIVGSASPIAGQSTPNGSPRYIPIAQRRGTIPIAA